MNSPTFAIIGTGALGGFYGGLLAKAGFEVHFLLRSDAEFVRQQGLKIDSTLGNFHLPSVNVHETAESLPPCDVTIVALKTTQNHLLPQLLPAPTREGGMVLVLQNGLHPETDSAAIVGAGRVLGGVCFLCSNKVGPGHIRHLDYGRIVMGQFAPDHQPQPELSSHTIRVAQALQHAGIDAVPTKDLWMARWKKLMWNIPFNGLSVVLDAQSDALVNTPPSESIAVDLMEEIRFAANAYSREIPSDAVQEMIQHTRAMVPYDSSMRLDFLAGRPLELETIFAQSIRAAANIGRPMHRVEMLYRLLDFLQRSGRTAHA